MTARCPENVTSNASRKREFSLDSHVSRANPSGQLMVCRAWTRVSDRWHRLVARAQLHQLTVSPALSLKHRLEQVGTKLKMKRVQFSQQNSLKLFRNFDSFRTQRSRNCQVSDGESRRNSALHWGTAIRFGCLVRRWVRGTSGQEWWKCRRSQVINKLNLKLNLISKQN